MDTFNQVKSSVMEAAKEAKDKVVELGHEAKERVQELADKLRGQGEASPDVLQLLKQDHELVAALFEQIRGEQSPGQTREDLFAQLKYELDAHAAAEEKLFYPAIEQASKQQDLVRRALAEHEQVRRNLKELAAMPMQSGEWLARLNELKQDVDRHVQMEEDQIFKAAREAFNEEQLKELGRCIEQEKDAQVAEGKSAQPAKSAPPSAVKAGGKGGKKSTQRVAH